MGHLLKFQFLKSLQKQIGGNLGNLEPDSKNSLKHKMQKNGIEVDQIFGQVTKLL